MQLKHNLFLIFSIINITVFAQKKVEIIDGKILYDSIYHINYTNLDELQKINQNGTLLIKMDLLNGELKNIKFSSEYPTHLVKILKKTLQNIKIKSRKQSQLTNLIIPIFYDYRISSPTSLTDLINQIPAIDVNNLPPLNLQEDYQDFLGIRTQENNIIGIHCIFLPWIKLNGKIP